MKRYLFSILLLLPASVAAAGITVFVGGTFVTMADVPSDAWFATYVRSAAEAGIVSGYNNAQGNPTGKFGPADNITVEQALKVAVEGAGYDETKYSLLPGLSGSHWADRYLSVAIDESFSYFDRNEVLSTQPATRAEVAQLIVDAFKVKTDASVTSRYLDVKANTQYALAIEALTRDGVVTGDTNAAGQLLWQFRPTAKINRAEAVKIVMKAREKYGRPGSGLSGSNDTDAGQDVRIVVVNYTDDGFEPSTVRVPVGATVVFVNESNTDMWVASDPHPVHTDLSAFDAREALGDGEEFEFTFNTKGNWEYHNHVSPSDAGLVIVE